MSDLLDDVRAKVDELAGVQVDVDEAENMARFDPDRRFRCESMIGLAVIRFFAPPEQRERATATFEELVADPDESVAMCAQWGLDGRDIAANADGIKGWYDLD